MVEIPKAPGEHDLAADRPTAGGQQRIDRRRFLAAGTATAAWASLAGSARGLAAGAPHTFVQGAFEVTVVSDGTFVLPPPNVAADVGFLYPNVPRAELETFLRSVGLSIERVQLPNNVVLIRTPADLILIDAGAGGGWQPTAGKLAENLQAAGIDKAKISKIVFTHAHPDHLWGVVEDDGALRFPNASYLVAENEWNFWMAGDVLQKVPENFHGFALGAQRDLSRIKDRLKTVKTGDEIVAGVRVIDTPGHTPGHVSIELAGGDGLIVVGDVAANALVSFAHPEWRFAIDSIPELAITSRRRLLDRAATDKTRLVGSHWPYPGLGVVERKDNAYRFVPTA
jgi:glyoxylase-like metal-dependent hydrolase (beta-lactamase superfamily II)